MSGSMKKLSRDFYNRDTIIVAKEMLGKLLVYVKSENKKIIGRIVETEAYLGPHDLAAHSSKGLTKRTQVLFGPPGYAYVYLIYGIYYCLNVVTEAEGSGSAVLIRAIQPVAHIKKRTCGPGLLCQAMCIDKQLNGHDLLSDDFYLATDAFQKPFAIVSKSRIGVDYAGKWAKKKLRFYIKGNLFISKL